jgi:hypothetical protein
MKVTIVTRDPNNRREIREAIQQVCRDLIIGAIHAVAAELPRRLNARIGREGRTLSISY